MRKIGLISILVALSSLTQMTYAQSTTITLRGIGQTMADSVHVIVKRDFIFSERLEGDAYQIIPLDSNSTRTVIYDQIPELARLSLFSYRWPNYFIGTDWLMEAGDSVVINFIKWGEPDQTLQFSGRGAAKYQLAFTTSQWKERMIELYYDVLETTVKPDSKLALLKQLEAVYKSQLNQHRHALSRKVYEAWTADIVALASKTRLLAYSAQKALGDKAAAKTKRRVTTRPPFRSHYAWQFSRDWVDYSLTLEKWKLLEENRPDYQRYELSSTSNAFTFKELSERLQRLRPGVRRDYLLTFSLTNPMRLYTYFGGCHPNDFKAGLERGLSLIEAADLKVKVNEIARYLAPGAQVKDLGTINTSGDTIKLSQFTGKKVLLDIWIADCTGCKQLKNELITTLVPLMKDRSDIVIWSVGLTADFEKWKAQLGTNSHSAFVNSWLNNSGKTNPWTTTYQTTVFPFVMLVDENGRLISTTVRKMDTLIQLLGF